MKSEERVTGRRTVSPTRAMPTDMRPPVKGIASGMGVSASR